MPLPSPTTPARQLAGNLLRVALEIQWFKDRYGRGPHLIDIARALGLRTYGGAYYYVAQLKRKGVVRRGLGGWVVVKPEAIQRRGTLLTCIGQIS